MSSEKLGHHNNVLKGDLGGGFDILTGSTGEQTDLGIAKKFGGAAAAYSLRDIGAMNGRVVRVRRDSDSTEEDFSAFQVQSGALETWVQDGTNYDGSNLNGEAKPASSAIIDGVTYSSGTLVTLANKHTLEYTLNDQETANRFMRYMVNPSGDLTNLSNGDVVYVSFNLTVPNGLSIIAQLRDNFTGVSSTASFSGSGFKAFSLTRNSTSGTIDNIMFQSSGVANATIRMTDIKVSRTSRNGFVTKLYDQSGYGRDASQGTTGSQPFIVRNGGQVKLQNQPSIDFDGRGSSSATGLVTNYDISSDGSLTEYSIYGVFDNTVNTPHSTLISAGQPISNSTSYGGFNVFVNQNGGRLEIEHQENPNTSKTTIRPTNLYSTGDGYKIITINYNSSSLLSKLVNVTSGSSAESTSPALPKARNDIAAAQYLKIGASYTFQYRDAWQGFISEIIMFEDDIRSDNDDIVNDLTDFYGQPSSTP